MALILSFVFGFMAAQATWWVAAGASIAGGDAAALGGAPAFRFLMIAGVEILVAAGCFAIAATLAAQGSTLDARAKSVLVSLVAGAATATIAAGPHALIPPVVKGEAQLLVYVLAAAVLSAALGALVGRAFRAPPAQASPTRSE